MQKPIDYDWYWYICIILFFTLDIRAKSALAYFEEYFFTIQPISQPCYTNFKKQYKLQVLDQPLCFWVNRAAFVYFYFFSGLQNNFKILYSTYISKSTFFPLKVNYLGNNYLNKCLFFWSQFKILLLLTISHRFVWCVLNIL